MLGGPCLVNEWQPDEDAPLCNLCKLRFYGLRFRPRHHCRYCGLVYCAKCTRKAYWLRPTPSQLPVRTCYACKCSLDPRGKGHVTLAPGGGARDDACASDAEREPREKRYRKRTKSSARREDAGALRRRGPGPDVPGVPPQTQGETPGPADDATGGTADLECGCGLRWLELLVPRVRPPWLSPQSREATGDDARESRARGGAGPAGPLGSRGDAAGGAAAAPLPVAPQVRASAQCAAEGRGLVRPPADEVFVRKGALLEELRAGPPHAPLVLELCDLLGLCGGLPLQFALYREVMDAVADEVRRNASR